MSTVEAIQAHLIGIGYILWPGSPENPPQQIKSQDLHCEDEPLRIFEEPNRNGPVFEYEWDVSKGIWLLKRESGNEL